ncbi:MAG: hypothetical protein HQL03_05800 [Nitrospirae bacterium]|nr:hypothetical protein [Nitrospirota bacterium]MBF0591588.1 hypothetical protein [Nitrospirota bacterium]
MVSGERLHINQAMKWLQEVRREEQLSDDDYQKLSSLVLTNIAGQYVELLLEERLNEWDEMICGSLNRILNTRR